MDNETLITEALNRAELALHHPHAPQAIDGLRQDVRRLADALRAAERELRFIRMHLMVVDAERNRLLSEQLSAEAVVAFDQQAHT